MPFVCPPLVMRRLADSPPCYNLLCFRADADDAVRGLAALVVENYRKAYAE